MMNLTLTTDCNVRRKESRQPGRQKSLTQVMFRPDRIVINAQWLCAFRTLPVLCLALWSLGPFLGHGLLDDFRLNFCLTFAVFHVRVCCKFTAFLPSHFDFSTDFLPAEYPSTNIWEIHKYNPLLLRGQHAVASVPIRCDEMICWNSGPFFTLILWRVNILGWIKLIKKLLQKLPFKIFFYYLL